MKKFLSLFLCAVILCGCGLNAHAANLSFYDESDEIPDRMEMELTYLYNIKKPIFDDFDLIDDGLIMVSKNIQNPAYDSYRNIIADAKSTVMPKLPSCEEREIPVVVLNRNDNPNIIDYFGLMESVDSIFDPSSGCIVVWEDKFDLDKIEYQMYCATIGYEISDHVSYWLSCIFYVEFTNWLRKDKDPEIVNKMISEIRDDKYEDPIDFFDKYENTEILPFIVDAIKYLCYRVDYSFEKLFSEIGVSFCEESSSEISPII